MKKDIKLSRRRFLVKSASALIGGAAAGVMGSSIIRPKIARAALPGYLPYDPGTGHPILDVKQAQKYAWMHFHKHGG